MISTRHTRVRIKMCGTTRAEDIKAAAALGIDAIGFIFVADSPRYVNEAQAAELTASVPPFITRVGVFVDRPVAEIEETVDRCGLTQVQLHGNEPPGVCLELQRSMAGCSICKAFRVGGGSPPVDVQAYRRVVDSILLDTYVKGVAGGTGEVFDWDLVNQLQCDRPVILAGGLSPGNVLQALATVWPYAIDINSGVEQAPGIKDHRLLAQLVSAVRQEERKRFDS